MMVKRALKIVGHGSWIIQRLSNNINQLSMNWLPLWVKVLLTILLQPFKNNHQRIVNHFWSCILDNQRDVQLH